MTVKFLFAQVLALAWLGVSVLLSLPWVRELAVGTELVITLDADTLRIPGPSAWAFSDSC